MGITFALSVVILFFSLFFIFQRYVVDGQIQLPWLLEEAPETTPPPFEPAETADSGEVPPDAGNPNNELPDSGPPNTTPPDDIPSDGMLPDDEP